VEEDFGEQLGQAAQTDRHDERNSMMAAIRVDAIVSGPKFSERA
jgi:hypothetical protein